MEFKKRLTKRNKARHAQAQKDAGRVRVMVRGKKRWINPTAEATA